MLKVYTMKLYLRSNNDISMGRNVLKEGFVPARLEHEAMKKE